MSDKEIIPKVFISYCWNGQERQEQIIDLVARLAADGIDSVVDIYDLKEGDDKYHFMEKMVVDSTVSHVLVLCDKGYTDKANQRLAGVGTESLIISQEIYSKVSQSKFIPLIMELNDNGEAYTPIYLKSRIYLDFSSPEKENSNWERLVRLLFGKPELVKPTIGKRPSYLENTEQNNTYGIDAKFKSLKQALLSDKKTTPLLRADFFETCYSFIDSLRIRSKPEESDFQQKVIDDYKQLISARNLITDWCILESQLRSDNFSENLISLIEKLLDLSSRPEQVSSWQDVWFHAHKTFAYECILYIVSSLIKTESYSDIHEILTSSYRLPETTSYNNIHFCGITELYYHSDYLQEKLAPQGRRLNSTIAELLKNNANRSDISFEDVMQADLVITMFNFLEMTGYWYPQTLYYAPFSYNFPLFISATQHKHFAKLLTLTGYSNKNELKEKILTGIKQHGNRSWSGGFRDSSYEKMFNIEQWDTIK